MLDRSLAASATLVVLLTLALLRGGRRPIGWRIARLPAVLLPGAVASWVSGPIAPLAPGVIVTALTLLVALVAPRRWWAVGAATFGSVVVGTAVYSVYLARVTLILDRSPLGLVLGLLLLGIELGALALMLAAVFEMLDALCRPVSVERPPPPPGRWPTVCLQVPAHQEPPELVLETIQSLLRIDYPPEALVVQVIDNNTSDASLWGPLEAECGRLREAGRRVEFAHLERWPGFKAGALNWGRRHLDPDVKIVGIVDADYLVEPGFLKATVPYFVDPAVSFVQTPQEYRAWQESAFFRACHTGFGYFFRVGMVSRSYRNSIIFAGTMGLIRRSVLDAMGGWDEAIITEDAEASLRMLARGGRGVYVPRPYGRGLMPLTYEALRGQRFRWAFGGIQILRKHWRALLPWSDSPLSQRQRRDYLLGALWWFNDALTLGFAAFIAATAAGVVSGHPFVIQRLAGLGIVLPLLYVALGLVRYVWGIRVATRVTSLEAMDALRVNLSLSWVVTLACVRALIEERGVFLRTPKFRGGSPAIHELRVVAVETALAAAAVGLAGWVALVAGFSLLTIAVDLLLLWSAFIYGSAARFALGDPDRPPAGLRTKAAMELRPDLGQALVSGPVRLGVTAAIAAVALFLGLSLAGEAARPPVGGILPLEGPLGSPAAPGRLIGGRNGLPAPSPSPPPSAPASAPPSPSTGPRASPTPLTTTPGPTTPPSATPAAPAPSAVAAPSAPPPSAPPPSAPAASLSSPSVPSPPA